MASVDVRECRFGDVACPAGNVSRCTSDGDYCECGFTGPLCSECLREYFQSANGCELCQDVEAHLPNILVGAAVLVAVALGAGGCYVRRSNLERWPKVKAAVEFAVQLYQSGNVKFFILVLTFQVISQFTSVVASTGSGDYPEPAATFARRIGAACGRAFLGGSTNHLGYSANGLITRPCCRAQGSPTLTFFQCCPCDARSSQQTFITTSSSKPWGPLHLSCRCGFIRSAVSWRADRPPELGGA